jgi:NitT/TauT family transport system substrate-binding protein
LPYSEEYCCAVLGNGKFIEKNPRATAAATRALLKAAKWVETNPAAAARISVEKKYLASTVDQNTFAISHLRYVPSVEGARTAVKLAAGEMQQAGMLRADTDLAKLVERSFITLDGVTDEWLQKLEVEKIEGAQVTPGWMRLQYARYSRANPADVFCGLCLVPAI